MAYALYPRAPHVTEKGYRYSLLSQFLESLDVHGRYIDGGQVRFLKKIFCRVPYHQKLNKLRDGSEVRSRTFSQITSGVKFSEFK